MQALCSNERLETYYAAGSGPEKHIHKLKWPYLPSLSLDNSENLGKAYTSSGCLNGKYIIPTNCQQMQY